MSTLKPEKGTLYIVCLEEFLLHKITQGQFIALFTEKVTLLSWKILAVSSLLAHTFLNLEG